MLLSSVRAVLSTLQSSNLVDQLEQSGLTDFIATVTGERHLRVEESLGEGFVRLRVAEAERRQAKHDIRCIEDAVIEMLRNARDAGASQIYVATSREGSLRTTTMLDNGEGVPPALHDHIFEARVTSKLDSMHEDRWGVHGRGMALYSIRENSIEARIMSSAHGLGSAIRIISDSDVLSERADQSRWPVLSKDEAEGEFSLRGPHNIYRSCCEFAIEERDRCTVYVGTPAEIIATIISQVRPTIDLVSLVKLSSFEELPVLERFGVAADAKELSILATSLGLDISARTAQRILTGEIVPLQNTYAHLYGHGSTKKREIDLERDRRHLRITSDDSKRFLQLMSRDFAFIADRYYLRLLDEPQLRVHGTRVIVTFDTEAID